MKRAGLLLALLAFGCGEEPGPHAAGVPGNVPYAAVPPGSAPRGTSERLADIAPPGPPATSALIAAGAQAYRGYCAPCHGASGLGDGPVVEKGFPRPAPFGDGAYEPAEIVSIIGDGKGLMPPLREQVPPHRRWAIAYYLTSEGSGGD